MMPKNIHTTNHLTFFIVNFLSKTLLFCKNSESYKYFFNNIFVAPNKSVVVSNVVVVPDIKAIAFTRKSNFTAQKKTKMRTVAESISEYSDNYSVPNSVLLESFLSLKSTVNRRSLSTGMSEWYTN